MQNVNNPHTMIKISFLIEQFIYVLLVSRTLIHLFEIRIFIGLVFVFIIAKYFKEGFNITIVPLLISFAMVTLGEIYDKKIIIFLGIMLIGYLNFFGPKAYKLPAHEKVVGFREESLENNLYCIQLFPLMQDKPIQRSTIRWHHSKEMSKMMEHVGITNKLLVNIGKLMISYVDHYAVPIGAGEQAPSDQAVIFSHGRGATPYLYTQILIHFAENGYCVSAVQHTEVSKTGLTDFQEIKRFREKEVQMRAAELYQDIVRCKKRKIILMGHSYGCATLIQAYHSLEDKIKKKVSHLILLDPWFFPLSEFKMKSTFHCPVLVLATQDFVKYQDMHQRNTEFCHSHTPTYLVWKNAVHLHQTDLGYICGSLLGIIQNSQLTHEILMDNLQAIDLFLQGKDILKDYENKILPKDYVPKFKKQYFPL